MIRDRLSRMRFPGVDLGAPTPGETTIRHIRKVRCRPDGTPLPMIAVPVFGHSEGRRAPRVRAHQKTRLGVRPCT